jgi:hypothetical protein
LTFRGSARFLRLVFSRKGIVMFSLCAVLFPRAFALPDCGVCASGPQLSAFSSMSALGEKKILYIRVNYPDDATEPITTSAAENLMTEVSSFYRTHSNGRCWTSATITPLVTMPLPKSTYFITEASGNITWNSSTVLGHAREAARSAGFDYRDYDLEVVRFNAPFLFSWANIGARGAWLVSSHPYTTIHEIGHNLGLNHANAWKNGANIEYGDVYDVMGDAGHYQRAGLNTIHKRALGWLDASHEKRITASGVYRLYAQDTNKPFSDRTYALRVRKDEERDYWIEKRQNFDFSDDMEFSGVLLYWDEWSQSNGGTHLLDPVSDPGYALPIFTPFADPAGAVRIIPLHQSADRAYTDVAVILGDARLNILPGLLHFAGEPNRSYTVETSANLQSWQLLTQTNSLTGDLFVPMNMGSSKGFYRVR